MLANFKKALVLFVIGIISGVSIWGANELTAETIALNVLNREKGFYREILDIDDSVVIGFTDVKLNDLLTEVTVFEDTNANEILDDGETIFGLIYKGEDSNNYGDVTVLVGIKDDAITRVIISESTNTPNFVKRIETNNLDPFMGMDVNEISFDEKTGATHTYGSVKEVVIESVMSYLNRGDE
jgi:Na+-translocating ferredoxin:NAD+ oxidoreductase RnfG subunit